MMKVRAAISILICTLLMSALSPTRATTQDPRYLGVPWCEADSGKAVVRGRLLPDPEVQTRHVYIQLTHRQSSTTCSLSVDLGVQALAKGAFEFYLLPPGNYELSVRAGGARRTHPITFALGPDATLVYDFPLPVENRVLDCMSIPTCADVLTRWTSAEVDASIDERLRIFAHRLALAITIEEASDSKSEWVACVEDGMIAALREVYPVAAPHSECPLVGQIGSYRGSEPYHHAPSGRRALKIEAQVRSRAGSSARVTMTASSHGNGAAFYECTVELVQDGWVPGRCWLTGVS